MSLPPSIYVHSYAVDIDRGYAYVITSNGYSLEQTSNRIAGNQA